MQEKGIGVVLWNSLENYNTLERDFGMDVWEGLEHVEFWMGIVDRIVFP